jgi:single-strand DNA-binding protein
MNNLNSILLEGTTSGAPLLTRDDKGVPHCTFTIASTRYYKNNTDLTKETTNIPVEAEGKLAEQCAREGREGRSVRVVGRLKQKHWQNAEGLPVSKLVIVSEHIEWKPEFRVKPAKEQSSDTYER